MAKSSRFSSITSADSVDSPDTNGMSHPPVEHVADVLARCMLNAVLTARLRRLLKSTAAHLILIKTADEAAAKMIDRYLSDLDRAPVIEAFTAPRKTGSRFEPVGRDQLSMLARGRSVILISQDLDRVIVPEALAAADAIITVPHPSLSVIRKTIREMTGGIVRGLLPSDVEGLTLLDLTSAIRPGLSARDCVANLRRAALMRLKPQEYQVGVPLEDLALTKTVSVWAFETLRLMEKVTEGEAAASALRFACLEGPTGTGKSTLAESLAWSAGWVFIPTSVGQWFADSAGNLGDVIRAARQFFDEIALSNRPVVGLLDEIDALPNRAVMDPKDAPWWTAVVNFVLTEIDRLRKAGKPVLLLAATNHFDHLDTALVRPGRLERKMSVLPPNEAERREMFATCLGDKIGDDGLSSLARLSLLATPAAIESWCQSAIAAADMENRALELRDLLELVAPKSNRPPEIDRAIAIHEAGHAIVAHELGLPITEISILGIGDAGGWVNTGIGNGLLTRRDVERMATTMLAGRAADTLVGGGANAGAVSDIEKVNTLLRRAMLDFGLYNSLTNAANSDLRHWNQGISLWTTIGVELARLYEQASEIVDRRRRDIFNLVDVLLVERVVNGSRLNDILAAGHSEDAPESPDRILVRA